MPRLSSPSPPSRVVVILSRPMICRSLTCLSARMLLIWSAVAFGNDSWTMVTVLPSAGGGLIATSPAFKIWKELQTDIYKVGKISNLDLHLFHGNKLWFLYEIGVLGLDSKQLQQILKPSWICLPLVYVWWSLLSHNHVFIHWSTVSCLVKCFICFGFFSCLTGPLSALEECLLVLT